jgi:HAD superfamily hydrolase (TIGR01458 family)
VVHTIRAVLIDIEGVLCIGDSVIAGSLEALKMLREKSAPIRFVTNTTRRTRADIVRQLGAMGFDVGPEEVITGALAARQLLQARGLRPFLLVHPGLMPDFAGIDASDPDAVVIGDAAEGFSYGAMNTAFRILLEKPGAPLLALANNRYFRAADGLWLDAGPYVAALEYASRVQAVPMGKPAAAIFQAALEGLQAAPQEAVMVGDDIESDIGGAQAAGLGAVLVRTGKYRAADERHAKIRADAVADDFSQAVAQLILPRLGA